MKISSGDNIRLYARYRAIERLVKRLVEKTKAGEVLKKIEYYAKISRAGLQWGTVKYKIEKRAFYLPNNLVPVTKLRLNSLES